MFNYKFLIYFNIFVQILKMKMNKNSARIPAKDVNLKSPRKISCIQKEGTVMTPHQYALP